MALDPFRFELANAAPASPPAPPTGAQLGLGGVASLENTNPLPLGQRPLLGPDGSVWAPAFGRFPTVAHPPPAPPGTGTGGGGGTTPPPAPATTYSQTEVRSAIRQALQAGADNGGPLDQAAARIVAALFPAGTTGVTMAQIQAAIGAQTNLPRSITPASITTRVGEILGEPAAPTTGTGTGTGATTGTGTGGTSGTTTGTGTGTGTGTQAAAAAPASATTIAEGATGRRSEPRTTTGTGTGTTATDAGAPVPGGGEGNSTDMPPGPPGVGPVGPNGEPMGPGLAALGYGLATGQTMDPGFALASIGTLALGPAGLATSLFGGAMNALGAKGDEATDTASMAGPSKGGTDYGDPTSPTDISSSLGDDGSSSGDDSGMGMAGAGTDADTAGSPGGMYGGDIGDASGASYGGDTGSDYGGDAGDTGGGGDAGGDAGGGESDSGGDSGGGEGESGGMYARGGMVNARFQAPQQGLAGIGANYAGGGMVQQQSLAAPNPPGPDDGYAFLDGGEFVVRADQVPKYLPALQAMNEGRYPPDLNMSGGRRDRDPLLDLGQDPEWEQPPPDRVVRPEQADPRRRRYLNFSDRDMENSGSGIHNDAVIQPPMHGPGARPIPDGWARPTLPIDEMTGRARGPRWYQDRNQGPKQPGRVRHFSEGGLFDPAQGDDKMQGYRGYAEGGMVDPMQPGAPQAMAQGQPMPGDADEGYAGMEDDGDYGSMDEGGAMMGGHPLMPPEMGGMLTPDMAMERVTMLPPDLRQTLAMSLADPITIGAWMSLLGPGFEGVLSSLVQPQGAMGGMPGGAAPQMGGQMPQQPAMGGGGGGMMGGYAGGGLVHPSMPQSRNGLPPAPMNGAPPGFRPPGGPMKREPTPFQPPRRGMAGVGM